MYRHRYRYRYIDMYIPPPLPVAGRPRSGGFGREGGRNQPVEIYVQLTHNKLHGSNYMFNLLNLLKHMFNIWPISVHYSFTIKKARSGGLGLY